MLLTRRCIGGLQVGGGITAENCLEWIEAGASKVCSSCVHSKLWD